MSRAVIVDASVALKWFVIEPDSAVAELLLTRDVELHAPDLLRLELGNALWRNVRQRHIGEEQALEGVARVGRVVTRWHATENLVRQALTWSIVFDYPIYDLCYVALAQSTGFRVVTSDTALLRKLAGTPQARHLVALADFA